MLSNSKVRVVEQEEARNGGIPRCSLDPPPPPPALQWPLPQHSNIQMSPKHCCCKLTSPHNSQTKHLDSICMTCPQNWLQELAMHGKTGLYHLKSGAHSIFPSSFIDMHNMWSSSHPCIRYCQQREISIIFFGICPNSPEHLDQPASSPPISRIFSAPFDSYFPPSWSGPFLFVASKASDGIQIFMF